MAVVEASSVLEYVGNNGNNGNIRQEMDFIWWDRDMGGHNTIIFYHPRATFQLIVVIF